MLVGPSRLALRACLPASRLARLPAQRLFNSSPSGAVTSSPFNVVLPDPHAHDEPEPTAKIPSILPPSERTETDDDYETFVLHAPTTKRDVHVVGDADGEADAERVAHAPSQSAPAEEVMEELKEEEDGELDRGPGNPRTPEEVEADKS